MVELLAPAGDLEKLKVAFDFGADAVYIGGPILGLRANAKNFTFDDISEGVKIAHNLGKKLYVTVNIVLHNKEALKTLEYLKKLDEIGVDAIIVSDPYIIKLALDNTNLEVHLSTQQSCLNRETVQFFKELGVTRIVLARECTREDIKDILNEGIEIETFIHGAMCAGYSGRCVMSNLLTMRDANRGGCSQICRWDFDLLDKDENKIEASAPFTFCSKDLSMLRYIPEMIDMGIASFKIEGRMRSSYYLATVISIYRKVIDEYLKNKENYKYNIEYEKDLFRCANRDSVPQFYDGTYDYHASYYNGRVEETNKDFLGVVLDYDKKNKMITLEQRNYFKKGDVVEFFDQNYNIIEYVINDIYDEDNNIIDVVRHPLEIVKMPFDTDINKNSIMRIKRLDK